MQPRQLIPVLLTSLIQWIITNALLALLPVYAVQLGADPATIGTYLALAFFAIASGTVAAGWLSERFDRRRAFIIGAAVTYGTCTALLGAATQFWQLLPLTVLIFLSAGIYTSMLLVVIGMFWTGAARPYVFGLLGVVASMGGMLGGALSGAIVDRWGYAALFGACGALMLAAPVVAILIRDRVPGAATPRPQAGTPFQVPRTDRLGTTFYLLMLAAILSAVPIFATTLGRPLLMVQLHFSASEISGVVAVGGAASVPFPLLLGWLAGRFGHFRMIGACYVLIMIAMVIMVSATALWQFWVSGILLSLGGAGGLVGLEVVGRTVPPSTLSSGLARYGSSGWIGGIFGLIGAGYAIQQIGAAGTFMIGIGVAALALACLIAARGRHWSTAGAAKAGALKQL